LQGRQLSKIYFFDYTVIKIIGKIKNCSLMGENDHFQHFIDSHYFLKENQKALTPIGAYDIK